MRQHSYNGFDVIVLQQAHALPYIQGFHTQQHNKIALEIGNSDQLHGSCQGAVLPCLCILTNARNTGGAMLGP